ncbi:hypothetical protein H311_01493 [Anncaliia algerae PRA109]|nr:hypothetical protein H311_01493 [Anncaliia algerae PRA109]
MNLTKNQFEEFLIKSSTQDIIFLLMEMHMLKREFNCERCNRQTKFSKYKKSIDEHAWRCMNIKCKSYKKYFLIRNNSFFHNLRISLKDILKIIIRYSCKQQLCSLNESLDLSKKTILKILKKVISLIPDPNFSKNKIGGPGFIVQVDETMLNYKAKSHRGRSSSNKSDALCIVEIRNNITRVFACLIEIKKVETIMPIICEQVVPGSNIWTYEHKSYSSLSQTGFLHKSICHKIEFIDKENGVNTQSVESFHNQLKLEIKKRKGVYTSKRKEFLKEFCFYYNNRDNFLEAILNLLKV